MGQGFISKHILRDIANYIRNRKGTTAEIKPVDMKSELESIPTFEQGKQAEHDRFWDTFQQNGNRTTYRYAFYSTGHKIWDDNLYKPKYPITATDSYGADSMFQSSLITDTKVDVAIGPNSNYTFLSCNNLVTIRKLIVTEATTVHTQSFGGCNNLENITIEGVIACNNFNFQAAKKLSHDSLMSIINALQDKSADTSGTAWVVTIGSANLAKLTQEEIALAEQKGWSLV